MTTKRIRIESDGTEIGSRVYDADTGEQMMDTYRIVIDVSRMGYAAYVYCTEQDDYDATLDRLAFEGPITVRSYPRTNFGIDRMEQDAEDDRATISGWTAKYKPKGRAA